MTIQKNNSSIYGIFTNHNDEKLAYYPCPKNANSSAKLFFAKHLKIEDKFLFLGDEKPRYLQDKSVYFKENKTLKNMIAEMAHDTLNNKLKKGPTLVDMKPITKLINKIRISPIINL